jgi:hypothetical protein
MTIYPPFLVCLIQLETIFLLFLAFPMMQVPIYHPFQVLNHRTEGFLHFPLSRNEKTFNVSVSFLRGVYLTAFIFNH